MSIAGHGRRLDRLERRDRTAGGGDLAEALQQARQRAYAVHAIVGFVRALAGTDGSAPTSVAAPAVETITDSVPHSPPPPRAARPPERRPSENRVSRPNHNAVLTWDEIMRLGWQVETPPTCGE